MALLAASGQQAVTSTAAALANNPCRSVTVKALTTNAISVFVGTSGVLTSTGIELAAGDSVTLPVQNTTQIFVVAATTGASVSWVATS
jgi:hypothetical protein